MPRGQAHGQKQGRTAARSRPRGAQSAKPAVPPANLGCRRLLSEGQNALCQQELRKQRSGEGEARLGVNTQRTLTLGSIFCGNGGSNASSLKEMAKAHKAGEKQELVLQNKNIK